MNIFFALTLVVCLPLHQAVRLRENLNVLVPNNDVNLHAEIKKLLNGDEVDPKDLSDNEIESLNEIRSHKVNKLFNKSSKKNFSDNDENDDVAENQEERDLSRLNAASLNQNQTTSTIAATTPFNYSTSTTTSYEYETTSTYNWNSTKVTPTYPSTWSNENVTTPQLTTPNLNNLTSPSTPTMPVNGTEMTENVTTSLSFATTVPNYNSSTSHFLNITSSVTEQATEMTTSTTSETIYDDLQPDECLLGKAERRLEWVDSQGKLFINFIISKHGYVNFKDLSRLFNGSSQAEDFVFLNRQNLTVSIHKQPKSGKRTFYQKCFHSSHVLIN